MIKFISQLITGILLIILGLTLIVYSTQGYAYHVSDKVMLGSKDSCENCQEAKELLYEAGIPFTVIKPTNNSNYVPQLFVNNRYIGSGVGVVETYINTK